MNDKGVKRFNLVIPIELWNKLKEHVDKKYKTPTSFIKDLIVQEIEKGDK